MIQTLDDKEKLYVTEKLFEVSSSHLINRLRLGGVVLFFFVHCLNYYHFGYTTSDVHKAMLSITALWFVFCGAIFLAHKFMVSRWWIKFLGSFIDVFLLSMILWVGDGPKSPLVSLYLILLILSGLHFSFSLLKCTIVFVIFAYLSTTYQASRYRPEYAIEHSQILIFLATICLCAAIIFQLVGLFRRLVIKGDVRNV